MSVLGKTTREEAKKPAGWKKMLLPGYLLFSAIFIIYSLYTYFGGVVYQAGVNQGISSAVVQLMQQTGSKCEPVALTAGDQQVDVINIACLQQQDPATAAQVAPAPLDAMDSEETPAEGQ